MFVCELWPSTPHALRTRFVYPSCPGLPTWYTTLSRAPVSNDARIFAAISSRTSSHDTLSQPPSPLFPTLFNGYRIRSVSFIWLIVAGPLAQFLPRLPGWLGLPSNRETSPVSLSTYANKPQADSQLKHVVGTSEKFRSTCLGHAWASSSVWLSHSSIVVSYTHLRAHET